MSMPGKYVAPQDRPRVSESEAVNQVAELLMGNDPDADDTESEASAEPDGSSPETHSPEAEPPSSEDAGASEPDAGASEPDAEGELKALEVDALETTTVEVNGEQLTVAELRDIATSVRDLEAEQAAFSERKESADLEAMTHRREMETLLSVMRAANIPPQLIEQAAGRHEEWQEKQYQQLVSGWPEMKDPNYRAEQRERLAAAAAPYGYSRAEVLATEDARALMVLRRLAEADEQRSTAAARLREAADMNGARKAPAKRGGRAAAGKSGAKQAIERAKQSPDINDKVLGVAALISEGFKE